VSGAHRIAIVAVATIALSAFEADAQSRRTTSALASPATETPSWAVLRQALKSKDYAVRLLATQALGGIRTVDVSGWIEHSLADPEHDVRVAAVDALDRMGSRRALALLRSVRDDETEAIDIRALAASALINHSDP
jgi:HEAT repeat protein